MYLEEIFANATDLSSLITIEVQRGDESNIESEASLEYQITYTGYTDTEV